MLDVFKNNEKRQIEEGHAKRKRTKEQTTIYKTLHRKQTKDPTLYTQTKTNNVNNQICAILQTTGGKDEQNIVFHQIMLFNFY
jgi:hypothetical protein